MGSGGGGKGGSKAPRVPDYVGAANAQGQQNRLAAYENTVANRPTQTDVWGNKLGWSQTSTPNQEQEAQWKALNDQYNQAMASGDTKRAASLAKQTQAINDNPQMQTNWEQSITLNPQIQEMYDKYLNTAGQAQDAYGRNLQSVTDMLGTNFQAPTMPNAPDIQSLLSGLPQLPTYDQNSGQAVSDALYGSIMDRARPEQQRETDALNNRLRLQGLSPGTEAYNYADQNLSKAHGDVQTQAAQQATLAGYNEAANRYLNSLQGYNAGVNTQFGTADRYMQDYINQLQGQSQNFGQQLTERTQPLEELSFLAQLGQPISPSFASFNGATGYQPADLMGATQAGYNAQLGGYNSQNAAKGSLLGAGSTLGGAYLGSKL